MDFKLPPEETYFLADDTKIIRFIEDIDTLKKSIGHSNHVGRHNCEFEYSLPLNLLSYYEKIEGERADKKARQRTIELHAGEKGTASTSDDMFVI